jgi:hypothetical protein
MDFILFLAAAAAAALFFYYFMFAMAFLHGMITTKKDFWIGLFPFGLLIRTMYREFKKLK